MKRLSKRLVFVGGMLALIGAGISACWLVSKLRSATYAASHKIARTRMDIQDVALATRFYVQESGNIPNLLVSNSTATIDTKRLYLALFGEESSKYRIGQPSPHWKNSRELVDRWGNPLNVLVHSNGNLMSYVIRIWSNGPNGKNEDGNADDISSEAFRVEVH
jgi:hypothetical protein